MVTGQVFGQTNNSNCNPCYLHARFRDLSTNALSPFIAVDVGRGDFNIHYAPLASTWLFPVQPGMRTFVLEASVTPDETNAVSVNNPIITAIYVPFGPHGVVSGEGIQAPKTAAKAAKRKAALKVARTTPQR